MKTLTHTLLGLAIGLMLSGCQHVESPLQAETYDASRVAVAIADAQAAVERESMPDLPLPESGSIFDPAGETEPAAETPAEAVTLPERTADEIMEGLQQAFEDEQIALTPQSADPEPLDDVTEAVQSYTPTEAPTHDADGYLTQPAIEAWLDDHSGIQGWSYEGGNGGGALRSHLRSAHGWREDQVAGLTDSQLRELHSASHEGMLRPRSDINLTLAMAGPPADDLVPMLNEDDGYYYWNYNGRAYRWTSLEEGLTYRSRSGASFIYEDGYMHVISEAVQVQEVAPVALPRSTSSQSYSGGCPDGNCGNPRYYRTRRRIPW